MDITLDQIRAAVALEDFDDEAARDLMGARPRPLRPDRPYREGAVLILFFPGEEGLNLLLTRRTDTVEHHRRQISFPGGQREDGEPLLLTALRETEEEVGIPAGEIEVLGELQPFPIPPSAFLVTPFVGYLPYRPECRPDPREVDGVLEAPLRHLVDESRRGEETRPIRGVDAKIPYYDVPGFGSPPLWGATAMMLSGLLERLAVVTTSSR